MPRHLPLPRTPRLSRVSFDAATPESVEFRIDREKLERAREILGTSTELETIDAALDRLANGFASSGNGKGNEHGNGGSTLPPLDDSEDLDAFYREVTEGLCRLAASGIVLDYVD